jgi:hypothetical protein
VVEDVLVVQQVGVAAAMKKVMDNVAAAVEKVVVEDVLQTASVEEVLKTLAAWS